MECADKQSEIERSLHERKALEKKLEKVYKEGRAELELGSIDALHQRCLNAERLKFDLGLTLQSTQNEMKTMEMEYSEEVQQLRRDLAAARDECVGISDERLQLQQENVQLHKEMNELRNAAMLIQNEAKQTVSLMEHEYFLKEVELNARLSDLEESSRISSADSLLATQQKIIQRGKEEFQNLIQTFETNTACLRFLDPRITRS
ncbi:sodium channel and clathrin linker 1-like [Nothobranchius furzeri]|uniref:Sodium channel and clathrin linker 1-like n=2 Tax=Nothobranchius furzeri TaxID=105023 RepID=A0A9D3BJG1_NOTFU|nr:sodium channel and clathrin linker 1-like [Nothobranchius furzeri]